MSEELASIIMEQRQEYTGQVQSDAGSVSGFGWLDLGAISNLTNSALRMAEDFAEHAGATMQRELSRTQAEAQPSHSQLSTLPWESASEEQSILSDELMHKVLQLSLDDRNFIEESLVAVPFSFQSHVPVILRLLQLDSNLQQAHARLTPKMDEEALWRNYFWRVKYLRVRCGMEADVAGIAGLTEAEAGIHWQQTVEAPPAAAVIAKETPTSNEVAPVIEVVTPVKDLAPVRGGSQLLQDIEDALSPTAAVSIAPTQLIPDYVSVEDNGDEVEGGDENAEVDIEDLDLEDLEDFSGLDDLDLDEDDLEAEIERELLDQS